MYEELVEPLKELISWGSSPYPTKKNGKNILKVKKKYGEEVLNKITNISNEYFKTNAHLVADDNICLEKSKQDFLNKYPNACNEIVEILSWWYWYDCILH